MQRLVDEWVGAVGLNINDYGTHSVRRTKASLIYKATGNLRAVQILLGYANIENTVRYLGVDIDALSHLLSAPKFSLRLSCYNKRGKLCCGRCPSNSLLELFNGSRVISG